MSGSRLEQSALLKPGGQRSERTERLETTDRQRRRVRLAQCGTVLVVHSDPAVKLLRLHSNDHRAKYYPGSKASGMTSIDELHVAVTFSAGAGAVHRRAGCMVVAGAGGRAARSVQAGGTHGGAVLALR